MSLDPAALSRACAQRPVARVVVAAVRGSAPREAGAAMLVWADGQSGTIGGGALEYAAARAARRLLAEGADVQVSRHPLGPDLGQCCGGAVTLVTERVSAAMTSAEGPVFARRVEGNADMPLAVQRLLQRARDRGELPGCTLLDGWLVEPVGTAARPLWIWGAGHVGRALVHTLSPLPDFAITWVDTAPERFPDTVPDNVTALPAPDPTAAMRLAPTDAQHLILTYSHTLDLDLCHAALRHGFAWAGLIGSATKWARFRKRLQHLGHTTAQIDRITCPIGDPGLGKHPQAIALGVATALLKQAADTETGRGTPRDGGQDTGRAALA